MSLVTKFCPGTALSMRVVPDESVVESILVAPADDEDGILEFGSGSNSTIRKLDQCFEYVIR